MKHRRIPLVFALTSALALSGSLGFGFPWASRTSGQDLRNNPYRPKTAADLAALKAAEEKRARKSSRR